MYELEITKKGKYLITENLPNPQTGQPQTHIVVDNKEAFIKWKATVLEGFNKAITDIKARIEELSALGED
jgi:hypothetical protein